MGFLGALAMSQALKFLTIFSSPFSVLGPPNLCAAFNKNISKVQAAKQAAEALLTDLELTHYQQHIPQLEKKLSKILGQGT